MTPQRRPPLGKISITEIEPQETCGAGLPGTVTDGIAGSSDDPIYRSAVMSRQRNAAQAALVQRLRPLPFALVGAHKTVQSVAGNSQKGVETC